MKFLQKISEDVWYKNYKWETDNSVEDTFKRVSKKMASIEKENKEFYEQKYFELLNNNRYTPGGRILSNAGTELKGTSFVNCFVSGFTKKDSDSIEGIYDELKRSAQILKSEGGYGFCVNTLRPRGEYVNGIGVETCGAVEFLNLWDVSSDVITKGSGIKSNRGKKGIRKGAMMVTMSIEHPSIEEFITYKKKENKLNKFNMSVLVTDEFINAVEKDLEWKTWFPDIKFEKYKDEWFGDFEDWKNKGYPIRVWKVYKARELWNIIIKNVYNYAEPGVIFIDRINKLNNLYYAENILATNPCFRGNTLITTKEGLKPISSLVGESVFVYNGENWIMCNNFRKTGMTSILKRVKLNTGIYFDVTDYHIFYLENGKKKQAKDLLIGDKLEYDDNLIVTDGIEELGAYLKGFLLAEGTKRKGTCMSLLYLYPPKYCCETEIMNSLNELPIIRNNVLCIKEIYFKFYDNRKILKGMTCRDNDLYKWSSTYKKGLPTEVFSWNINSKLKLLKGLFDGDGCCLNTKKGFSYQLANKNKIFLIDIIKLLNSIGIYCSITYNRKKRKIISKLSNGSMKEYTFGSTYRITIPQLYAIKFSKLIDTVGGFNRLKSLSDRETKYKLKFRYNKIVSIEDINSNEEVYCCSIESNHKLLVNGGIITGQCGEQNLPINGSCNLGSINLTQYINENKSDYDYKKLKEDIPFILRFQDSVIDITSYPLEKMKEEAKKTRRVGIGYSGYATSLYMMEISYGSKKALKITENLVKFVTNELYKNSSLLAKEKGCFLSFDKEKYLNSNFIKQALEEETINYIKKNGMRNSHLTTQAPTGNSSIFLNNVSSGIEPVFNYEYIRTIVCDFPNGLELPIVNWNNYTCDLKIWKWTSEGRDKMLTTNYNNILYKYDQNRGLTYEEKVFDYSVVIDPVKFYNDLKENKEYIKTVDNLTIEDHLNVLSLFAKYIDSSISKTINVPNECSFEDFKDVYMNAYNTNYIKSITAYRSGTLMSVLKKNDEVRLAPERSKKLECNIHKVTINGNKWIVFIGLLHNKPYEIFVGKLDEENDKKIKSDIGFIIKKQKKVYQLEINNEIIIDDIIKVFENKLYDSLTRIISAYLRHQIPLNFLVEQLNKIEDKTLYDFEKVIARTLKKYIPDGVKSTESCPNCGEKLIFAEGCILCNKCGFSKCS
jgi:ribonucleoside-diphosphate reductase alpha chain